MPDGLAPQRSPILMEASAPLLSEWGFEAWPDTCVPRARSPSWIGGCLVTRQVLVPV